MTGASTYCNSNQTRNIPGNRPCLAHWSFPRCGSVRNLSRRRGAARHHNHLRLPSIRSRHPHLERVYINAAFVPVSYTHSRYTPLPYLSTWSSASHGASSYQAICTRKRKERALFSSSGSKLQSLSEDGSGCSSASS